MDESDTYKGSLECSRQDMDVTQIGLGATLLVIGTLTLIGPATLATGPLAYLVTGSTLFVTVAALLFGLWQRQQPT